jgi:predicted GIY-YIG superfamily endonuclease
VAKPFPRSDVEGTVYLLCIRPPLKHASHYAGWTEGPVEDRLARHLAGTGARLIRAALKAGLSVHLVRTWAGATRAFERILKKCGKKQLCPHCSGAAAMTRRRAAS